MNYEYILNNTSSVLSEYILNSVDNTEEVLSTSYNFSKKLNE